MKVNWRSGQPSARQPVPGVRKSPDVARLAAAFSSRGIDTRMWASAGTVGHLNDRGEFITSGDEAWIGSGDERRPVAVAAEPDGIIVDVRLEPSEEFVTARYHGVSCGAAGSILAPIQPGDEVLVVIPDGDLNSPAITIVAVGANALARIPSDWNNDRVLIDLAVPFEVRAPAIRMTSNNLVLNDRRVGGSSEAI